MRIITAILTVSGDFSINEKSLGRGHVEGSAGTADLDTPTAGADLHATSELHMWRRDTDTGY